MARRPLGERPATWRERDLTRRLDQRHVEGFFGGVARGEVEGEQLGGVEGTGGGAEEGDGGAARVVPDSGEIEDGAEEGGAGEVVETDCFAFSSDERLDGR